MTPCWSSARSNKRRCRRSTGPTFWARPRIITSKNLSMAISCFRNCSAVSRRFTSKSMALPKRTWRGSPTKTMHTRAWTHWRKCERPILPMIVRRRSRTKTRVSRRPWKSLIARRSPMVLRRSCWFQANIWIESVVTNQDCHVCSVLVIPPIISR